MSFDLILSLWVPTRIMQDVFICTQIDDCAGKTLCAMSPHLLEQHTLPDEPAMQTAHTDADVEKSREVWVGKRYPKDPDRERLKKEKMYRGFKQLDDGHGTIVPDGSVSTSAAAAATAERLRILSANIGQEVNDQCCMRYLQRAAEVVCHCISGICTAPALTSELDCRSSSQGAASSSLCTQT